MSDVTIEVFYSQTCPNCPAQKDLAKRFDDEADVKMTDVARNQGRAENHGVRSVPTTVLSGPALDQKMGFTGVMQEEKLATAVEVARGEADPEDIAGGGLADAIRNILPI